MRVFSCDGADRTNSQFAFCLLVLSALMTMTPNGLGDEPDHWAFRKCRPVPIPEMAAPESSRNPIDRFVASKQVSLGISSNRETDRATLIRRLSLDLCGLPPTVEEVDEFVADESPAACDRLVERLLASPRYGERWGKYWLDVAGYADSNGYFNADSDRPLAHRYRDYVVRAMNDDRPFDQFVREQLAGDELAAFDPSRDATRATQRQIELLEATHFLRNGPDGSGESDGNPDEVRVDRYSALEATQQIVVSSLFGLTIQCAKCHDHKFEPISQRDYYRWQAVLYPAFPIEQWLKPNERVVTANRPGEREAWQSDQQRLDEQVALLRSDFSQWRRTAQPKAAVLFEDRFDGNLASFASRWSNTAPGDDAPGGTAIVTLAAAGEMPDSLTAPAAIQRDGTLHIQEGGATGDKWLVTKSSFDWTPDEPNGWIQATFDLIDRKLDPAGTPAARVALFLAAHDFNDNGSTAGGNVLIDGNPDGGAAIHVDYPGTDSRQAGNIGKAGYVAGKNLGIRVTNAGNGKFKLEQLVDGQVDGGAIDLKQADLPNGAFGFEYCCGRSFIVDNVLIEGSSGREQASPEEKQQLADYLKELERRRTELTERVKGLDRQRRPEPGKIAWMTDYAKEPPVTKLLERGNPMTPGPAVEPGLLTVLYDTGTEFPTATASPSDATSRSTGRRTAWANWATQPDSRAASLVARVHVNRLWQHHFGRGLVSTPDNFGLSGSRPSHPELLEWLVGEFIRSGWSQKHLHRLIVTSATYRQGSQSTEDLQRLDPDNRWLSRFPIKRLDAEGLRDSWLFVSGELDDRLTGPYIPTNRSGSGEVSVAAGHTGAVRRSIYLQQRRTQVDSLLNLFDAPSVTFNCSQRPVTTMPLQSLTLLNSDFILDRAKRFADRFVSPSLTREQSIRRAYRLALGRLPTDNELTATGQFLDAQTTEYGGNEPATHRAWTDFAQMLLASNAFLYVE